LISGDVGDWLTGTRVERFPVIVRSVRSQPPPGIPVERATTIIWPLCGGPRDEVGDVLAILTKARLIMAKGGYIRLTKDGHRVATQDRQSGGTLLARALIDAGFFVKQARRLGELWVLDKDAGQFTCPRKQAIATAPQLIGLLRRFPGVMVRDSLLVPVQVARVLSDVWVLPSGDTIGSRGEYYSYRYEQMRALDATKIRWVALDDNHLGYDIEDLNVEPRRRIEVKASGGRELRFVLSSNEWRVAHHNAPRYEVHYWGELNMSRAPKDEFTALVDAGYPIKLLNVAALIDRGDLVAEPNEYLVTRPTPV